ncbi:MAG TPA: hypothetical protein VFJ51_09285 [Nitrososphaeraceae archaeon]|jgi:hypothetical protein|nr:hypothetical protein [Nitrososphaeraceae archaeon]
MNHKRNEVHIAIAVCLGMLKEPKEQQEINCYFSTDWGKAKKLKRERREGRDDILKRFSYPKPSCEVSSCILLCPSHSLTKNPT